VTEGPVIVQMIENFSPLLQPVTLCSRHVISAHDRGINGRARRRAAARSRLHRYL